MLLMKEAKLMEENQKLKQVIRLFKILPIYLWSPSFLIEILLDDGLSNICNSIFYVQSFLQEQRQSYESFTCSSSEFPPDNGSSDTSLKLGLVYTLSYNTTSLLINILIFFFFLTLFAS